MLLILELLFFSLCGLGVALALRPALLNRKTEQRNGPQ